MREFLLPYGKETLKAEIEVFMALVNVLVHWY